MVNVCSLVRHNTRWHEYAHPCPCPLSPGVPTALGRRNVRGVWTKAYRGARMQLPTRGPEADETKTMTVTSGFMRLRNVRITEARGRGGVGNPRGLTMYVGPGTRDGLVRPDPGSTPGRPAAV